MNSQTSSFQSDFITSEANYAWAEWTISAGATSASGGGFNIGTTNLNRKVAALGTKATGTWTLTAQITILTPVVCTTNQIAIWFFRLNGRNCLDDRELYDWLRPVGVCILGQ